MAPIVDKLAALVAEHRWQTPFAEAIDLAAHQGVAHLAHIRSFDGYLRFIDEMVRWAPRECGDSQLVHDKLVEFYFFLDQQPLLALQSPIDPCAGSQRLSPLSAWIVEFARSWGEYLDTPASAAHVDSFRTNSEFQWDDYMPPPSGYLTFNQFFARHVKPGFRPIAAPDDAAVLVSPADAVHRGTWDIRSESTVELKGIRWSIEQLLEGSAFSGRFAGGVFTHSALRTFDYHRWHAPVAGSVLETKLISGQAYLDVKVKQDEHGTRSLEAIEGAGYQFVQQRGLVILESAIGLVACLPVGMAQVSSVVITAEVGRELRKGEEMGYFQFGGSDFVMLFDKHCRAAFTCAVGAHSLQGSAIGRCGAPAPARARLSRPADRAS